MKYWFYIRNHNGRWHSDRWYLFAIGYNVQESCLVVWQLFLFGFCFCFFVDGSNVKKRPFPLSYTDWKARRRHRKP